MTKIENPDGTITYRIRHKDVCVQETISRTMLEYIKESKKMDWFETKIHSDLLRCYIDLVNKKNGDLAIKLGRHFCFIELF